MTLIHIHQPPTTTDCMVLNCPTCERPRRMLVQYAEWYGSTIRCAGCGESWQDGEKLDLPFAPGWRQRSIREAREKLGKIGVQA